MSISTFIKDVRDKISESIGLITIFSGTVVSSCALYGISIYNDCSTQACAHLSFLFSIASFVVAILGMRIANSIKKHVLNEAALQSIRNLKDSWKKIEDTGISNLTKEQRKEAVDALKCALDNGKYFDNDVKSQIQAAYDFISDTKEKNILRTSAIRYISAIVTTNKF